MRWRDQGEGFLVDRIAGGVFTEHVIGASSLIKKDEEAEGAVFDTLYHDRRARYALDFAVANPHARRTRSLASMSGSRWTCGTAKERENGEAPPTGGHAAAGGHPNRGLRAAGYATQSVGPATHPTRRR